MLRVEDFMKSIYIRNAVYFFIIALACLGLKPLETDKEAVVRFVIGDVSAQAGGQTVWRPLALNNKVAEGERIKTALNSRVELTMPDGTVLKINENTIFDVNEIKVPDVDREDRMKFTVWAGNIWASFKKIITSRQEREIESPSAVVAVRGTILEMEVDRNQNTTVRVEEGLVSVRSKDIEGEVSVVANQETFVEKGKSPTQPRSIPPKPDQTEEEELTLDINLPGVMFTDPTVLTAGLPVSGRVPPGTTLEAEGRPTPVGPDGRFLTRLRVNEGLNTIHLTARRADKSLSRDVRIYVNTKPPEIRLASPLVSGYYNRRDYSLSGGVFDPTPGDKVRVFINNEEVTEVLGRGSFNRTIILKEGENIITVVARDRSDNVKEMAQKLILDTVKPILTIMEPARVSVFRDEQPPAPPTLSRRLEQRVRGIVIDPQPSSGIKRVTLNGKDIKLHSDGSFEVTIPLVTGVNQLNFVVEDLAGNILREGSRNVDVSK
jgi:hypothetical protein